ncbi:hypothetical protein BpHYR1_042973, partial [Brachionus plicatilis]
LHFLINTKQTIVKPLKLKNSPLFKEFNYQKNYKYANIWINLRSIYNRKSKLNIKIFIQKLKFNSYYYDFFLARNVNQE